ncbi:hypothetical protein ACPPVO_26925 [Dactylosporangium sp. McL0621]|uniref:hypothetical protein n=1 Tax=Dactylosporangium sp. McL0621 TaxID=3415678 RepID=UPI003CFBB573
MPFADDEVRIDVYCGRDESGRPSGSIVLRVAAGALERHGLHPDQPLSRAVGPSPPKWWHAECERRWAGRRSLTWWAGPR